MRGKGNRVPAYKMETENKKHKWRKIGSDSYQICERCGCKKIKGIYTAIQYRVENNNTILFDAPKCHNQP
jgi:hypothetical protein